MLFVFAVAVAALVAFIKEWWSSDSTALLVLLALVAGGALSAREAFQAFGNEALVTVAAMFVLSGALTRTGAVERVGRAIERFGGTSEPRILFALMLACLTASAFINNTPIAVVFLPIVLGLAQRTGIAGSKFLTAFLRHHRGGLFSVIGTSTNVLIAFELPKYGLASFPLFEPLPLAAIGAALTVAYMVLIGRRLLPSNTTVTSAGGAGRLSDYLTEITVQASSPLLGRPLAEALKARAPKARVLQVIRGEAILQPGTPGLTLEVGDTLLAKGDADTLLALRKTEDLGLLGAAGLSARGRETALAELLVRPTSGAIGAKVGHLRLHSERGVAVLAVQRHGTHIREKVVDLALRLGDVLLVQGEAQALDRFRDSPDFVLLEGVAELVVVREKAWLALAVILAIIGVAAFEVLPISMLAVAGCLVVVAGGCLTSREAYRAIDLPLLVLMAGTIGLGQALKDSGGAAFLAKHVVETAQPFGDTAVLSAIYLVTNLLTAFVSNAAAALMMLPLALAAATHAGMSPQPFVIAVMFAASIDFSTPIGYQTNTFVYGPGGYRFLDYVKVGGPLNLLWWLLATLLIPVFWPLRG
jgi:di/tricarboxylate transporter